MKRKLLLICSICIAIAIVVGFSFNGTKNLENSDANVSQVDNKTTQLVEVDEAFYEESSSLVANQSQYIEKSDKGSDYEAARLLVQGNADLDIDNLDGLVKVVEDGNNFYLLQFSTSQYAEKADKELQDNPLVEYSVPDVKVSASAETGQKLGDSLGHNSWGAKVMGFDDYATESNKMSGEVLVGVIDSGVDFTHTLLSDRIKSSIPNYSDKDTTINYDHGINFVDPTKRQDDDFGHGTHTAGTIVDCASGDTHIKIVPLKVLDEKGQGYASNVRNALYYAADNNISVVNMSIVFSNSTLLSPIASGVKYATNNNVVCVASAGNNGKYITNLLPAACEEAITVGAIDNNMVLADFSNYGHSVDVVAPGANITSSMPGQQYTSKSGTSMAAPHVAAFAALLRHQNPGYGSIEVQNVIKAACSDLGEAGPDDKYGYGIPKFQNILNEDMNIVDYLEGRHKAEKAYTETYEYYAQDPDTVELAVSFDTTFNRLGENNSVYVYDSEGLIGVYKDDSLVGETLYIKGKSVTFVLEIKDPTQYKGFKVSAITELKEESGEENPTSEPIVEPELDEPFELPQKSINVDFNATGGAVNSLGTYRVTKELQLIGWSKSSSGLSIDFTLEDPLPGDGSIFLYPVWDEATIDELPTAEKEGCTFDGWFTEPVTGQAVETPISALSDKKYYAHWTAAEWSTIKTNHNYGNDSNEVWTYKANEDNVSALKLTFDESSQTAEGDYVEIFNKNKELVCKLSGNFNNKVVLVPGTEFIMHFVSDNETNDYGFQLSNVEPVESINTLSFFDNGSKISSFNVITGEQYSFDITPSRFSTIKLDANGGSVSESSIQREQEFDGWVYDDVTYSIGDTLEINEDFNFESKFYPVKVGDLPVPTMEGATFDGWYTEKSGGEKVNSSIAISSDVTYYAHWTYDDWNYLYSSHNYKNNSYTEWTYIADGEGFTSVKITFDERSALADDGDYIEILNSNKEVVKKLTGAFGGETVLINDKTFTIRLVSNESGNDFGFKVSNLVRCKYLVEMNSNGGNEEPRFYDFEEVGTFNPMFIPTLDYDVTLDANGGEFKDSKGNPVNDSINFEIPFLGWADTATATTPTFAMPTGTEETLTVRYTGSQTFYAVWGEVQLYTVDYASISGEGLSGGVSVDISQGANKFLPKIQREGYTFDGWYTKKFGGEKILDETKLTGDLKLYAHWIANDWHSIKSEHNYKSNTSEQWEYHADTSVEALKIIFDSRSKTSSEDYVEIYDANNKLLERLSGDQLSNKEVFINDNYFKITLVSDESNNEWGFELADVQSILPYNVVTLDSNGGNESNQVYYIEEGDSLKLDFVPTINPHTVTLNPSGGNLTSGQDTIKLQPEFTGWNSVEGKIAKDAEYVPQNDITLKAIWSDVPVGTLPVPTKENCIFNGWYTDVYEGEHIVDKTVVDQTLEVDPESEIQQTTVSSDVTYYAHWINTDLKDIESKHNYEDDTDIIWEYKCPLKNVKNIEFTFDENSKLASDGDYLEFLDSDGNVLKTITGNNFANTTVKFTNTEFTVHLHTDGSNNEWGFKIKDVKYRNVIVSFNPKNGENLYNEYFAAGESRAVDLTPSNSRTITYDVNGGTLADKTKVLKCNFIGWSKSSDGSTLDFPMGEDITATEDITLYAVYDAPALSSLPTPTKTGFEFLGWHKSLVDEDQVKAGDKFGKDTTLYAHWKTSSESLLKMGNNCSANTEVYWTFENKDADVIGYTLTISINEYSATPEQYYIEILDKDDIVLDTFTSGDTIAKKLQLDDTTFKLHFKTTVAADGFTVNLSKKFKSYTVKYVLNNEDAQDLSYPVEKTDSYKLKDNTSPKYYKVNYDTGFDDLQLQSSKAAASFIGWSLSPTDTSSIFDAGYNYAIKQDTTFYACYSSGKITTLLNPGKEKCTFNGWYTSPVGGEMVSAPFTTNKDVTLYAHWTINDYETFASLVSQTQYKPNTDKMWKLATSDDEIAGYELSFSGLSETADGDYVRIVDSKGAVVKELSGDFGFEKVKVLDKNFTVYFHSNGDENVAYGFNLSNCKPIYKEYSLTLDPNGGDIDSYGELKFSRETAVEVPKVEPTRSTTVSYDTGDKAVVVADQKYSIPFKGWSLSKTSDKDLMAAGAEIKGTADKTLYAIWGNSSITLPKDPTRENYVFDGWYTEKVGGTKVTDGYEIDATGKTLYAHWLGYVETSDLSKVESSHPYMNSYEGTWIYTHPNPDPDAIGYQIKFTSDSKTASVSDYVEVIDEDGNITKLTGSLISNKVVELPSASFKIHFVTDGSVTDNGFKLDTAECKFIYPTHTLKYDFNGGIGAITQQTFTKVDGTPISSTKPNRNSMFELTTDSGFTIMPPVQRERGFLGWSTVKDDRTNILKAGDIIKGNEDVTLYAVWGDAYVGAVNTPTQSGCEFLGWFTEKVGGEKVTSETKMTKDTVIYAHWIYSDFSKIATYHNYDNNEHREWKYVSKNSNIESIAIGFKNNSSLAQNDYVVVKDKAGKIVSTLDGSEIANASVLIHSDEFTIEFHSDGSGTAYGFELDSTKCHEYKYHTLSFDGNGGTIDNPTTFKFSEVTPADIPDSFYLGDNEPVRKATLSFDSGVSSVSVDKKTYSYTFGGWAESKDETDLSKIYNILKRISIKDTVDKVLYAIWLEPTVRLSELPKPTREYYEFAGWYTAKSGGTKIDNNFSLKGDTTLYAHWIATKNLVTTNDLSDIESDHNYRNDYDATWKFINANPETDSIGYQIKFTDDSVTASADDYVEIFDMNNNVVTVKDSSGAICNKFSGEMLKGLVVDIPTNSFTVHFVSDGEDTDYGIKLDVDNCKPIYKKHKITFDSNGCAALYLPELSVTKVDGAVIPDASYFTKNVTLTYNSGVSSIKTTTKSFDLKFLGWSQSLIDKDNLIMPGDVVTSTKDMTLHAIWKGEEIGKIPTLHRKNYEFLGFYTTNGKKATKASLITNNSTLTAKWKKIVMYCPGIKTIKRSGTKGTFTWSQKSSSYTGYQMKIATNKKFTKNVRIVTFKGYKTTKGVVKKLKKNKVYYYRMRSYRVYDGHTYYSGWSTIKKK